jgi:hypothetical protein
MEVSNFNVAIHNFTTLIGNFGYKQLQNSCMKTSTPIGNFKIAIDNSCDAVEHSILSLVMYKARINSPRYHHISQLMQA